MQTLKEMGVDSSTFKQADGSGLSRHNLVPFANVYFAQHLSLPKVSPNAMVQVFDSLLSLPNADGALFRSFLPVGGRSGTLKNRYSLI